MLLQRGQTGPAADRADRARASETNPVAADPGELCRLDRLRGHAVPAGCPAQPTPYRDSENFRDQLAAATRYFGQQNDTYQPEDRWALEAWRAQDPLQRPCYIAQGQADVALLSLPRTNRAELPDAQHHHGQAKTGAGGAAIAGTRPLAASAERGARLHQLRLDF